MSIKNTLLDAADYIEQHGWHQGMFQNDDGAVCASGALMKVGGDLGGDAYKALKKFLRLGFGQICMWNDVPGRTKEEVIAAFREAAKHVGV